MRRARGGAGTARGGWGRRRAVTDGAAGAVGRGTRRLDIFSCSMGERRYPSRTTSFQRCALDKGSSIRVSMSVQRALRHAGGLSWPPSVAACSRGRPSRRWLRGDGRAKCAVGDAAGLVRALARIGAALSTRSRAATAALDRLPRGAAGDRVLDPSRPSAARPGAVHSQRAWVEAGAVAALGCAAGVTASVSRALGASWFDGTVPGHPLRLELTARMGAIRAGAAAGGVDGSRDQ